MNIFDQASKKDIMRQNQLEIREYRKLKPKVIELSYYLDAESKLNLPKKKFNKEIKNLCDEFKVEESLQPIFVSNLFLPDEQSLLEKIEEALNFGCRIEDAPLYVSLNYQIPREIIDLKIAELEIYKGYYQKGAQEEIEKVFHKSA